MKRLTPAIVMVLWATTPLLADIHDPFLVQLRDQGYEDITVGRTWLGRIVITARRDDIAREIVLNARTGELLADQATLPDDRTGLRNVARDGGNDSTDGAATTRVGDDTTTATASDVGASGDILDTGMIGQ